MCGLAGIIGNSSYDNYKVFTNMLLFNTLRGQDSTGVFYKKVDNSWGWVKNVGVPTDLFQTEEYQKAFKTDKQNFRLLLGHTRAATIGSVTTGNAHPFKHGSVVLAHNGSLTNETHLYVDKERFETDSEHIAYAVSKIGIQETWKKICGAACLTFYDMKRRKFNIIRNAQRPMSFATTKDGKNFLYASEDWMIQVAVERNKIKLDETGIQEVPIHTLFTIDYSTKKQDLNIKKEKLDHYYTGKSWSNGWDDFDDPNKPYTFGYRQNAYSNYTREANRNQDDKVPLHINSLESKEIYTMYKPESTEYWRHTKDCAFCGTKHIPYKHAVYIDAENLACAQCMDAAKGYSEVASETINVN